MLLLLDNVDSFTWNLVQALQGLGAAPRVFRADEVRLADLEALRPTRLLLGPGPKDPDRAGITLAALATFAGRIPILGVCLGHQAIGRHFGGRVVRAPEPVHGQAWPIHHDGRGALAGLPSPFEAGRYHSLVVELDAGAPLEVSAWTAEGVVMGLRHRSLPIEGVQFHPESVLSPLGIQVLRNFLSMGTSE